MANTEFELVNLQKKTTYNHRDRNEIKTKSEQLNIRFSNTYR